MEPERGDGDVEPAVVQVLAEFAIDHASDRGSIAGLAPLVAAVLAPEFEELLSEDLRRRLLQADLLPPLSVSERATLADILSRDR